ncbi:MAG: YggT family protein [Candidatus Dasytiphilus stammeri]
MIKNIIDLYIIMLLLRCWMLLVLDYFYNPLVQLVIKMTQSLVQPLRSFQPIFYKNLEINSLIIAFFLTFLKYFTLLVLVEKQYELIFINIFLISILGLIKITGYLLVWIILLKWFIHVISQGYHPILHILTQLTNPILDPIRNHITNIEEFDSSPVVALLLIYFFNILGFNLFPKLWPIL